MHFGELKMRFLPTTPIHIIWYILKFFYCLEVSKCVFNMKYDLHSCSSYLFQKLSQSIFRSTFSTLVGYM
jgi:hypothetical protein